MILEKASDKIINILIKQNVILDNVKELYRYGIKILFSTVISFICIFILSYFFDHTYISISYFIVFSLLRLKIGGYHCCNNINCKLCYCSIYILFELLLKNQALELCFIASGFAYIYIYHEAPVGNRYKSIDIKQYRYIKNQLKFLLPAILLIQFITFLIRKELSYMISYIICVNAILAYLGKRDVRNEK